MFRGWVEFRADVTGTGLRFDLCEFNPNEPGVEKAEVEGPDGEFIRSRVYLAAVPSEQVGRETAERVNNNALDRLSFESGIVIQRARRIDDHFSPLHPQPGSNIFASRLELRSVVSAKLTIGLPGGRVKETLEEPCPAGEQYYGKFRSALRSSSPAEAFMHLYNILLMLFKNDQEEADLFIGREEPGARWTPYPRERPRRKKSKTNWQETTYTRLRNELGHQRENVNLDDTKKEMADHLGGRREVTKKAILLIS
ncbi:MAG: hypothetical protein HYS12_01875 [Planctomycetes bacterium]|nr:hypothetical protein [Planctomycetota bacterium]